MNRRAASLAAIAIGAVIATLLADPVPQDPGYYDFADQTGLARIPNWLNVLSNLPFLVIGGWGMALVTRNDSLTVTGTRTAWLIFFFGIATTALGSGYFHWSPTTDTLVWDRLPMTISFMSFVAIIVAEYFSVDWGRRLLVPLLVVGIASVAWWSYTESLGRGDLRAYALVQFLPMILIPMVVAMYRDRSDLGRYVWLMIGFYVLAKLAEHFDAEIFAMGQLLSGHSLKHLLAALAPASLLYGLARRSHHSVRGTLEQG